MKSTLPQEYRTARLEALPRELLSIAEDVIREKFKIPKKEKQVSKSTVAKAINDSVNFKDLADKMKDYYRQEYPRSKADLMGDWRYIDPAEVFIDPAESLRKVVLREYRVHRRVDMMAYQVEYGCPECGYHHGFTIPETTVAYSRSRTLHRESRCRCGVYIHLEVDLLDMQRRARNGYF